MGGYDVITTIMV